MIVNNIKLLHTYDVPIKYNSNESNFENIFILDNHNNNINNITYSCPIYFDEKILKTELMRRNIINIDNAFLFYSFMYQLAFGHFIEQCIPKINFFMTIKNTIKNIKFCIPKKRYNALTKEIVKFLEINEDDLIILNEDTTYIVNNLYYKNYDCADFNIDKIKSFNFIREKLGITPNIKQTRNIYLQKNTNVIADTDCYTIGKTRKIENEDILIKILKDKFNFEIITLGEHSLFDKSLLLSDVNILINQTGGNMYNLFFSNTPKHILFLSNNSPLHVDYINNILPKLNYYTQHSPKLLCYNSTILNADKLNNMNDPFIVDIEYITNYCDTNYCDTNLLKG